ncbi:MAG: hypothetical protein NTU49_06830 [Gammaproteobacteria bacterium]|nr:hypothetical protein [Gammaproteobacteria bacterium]
MNKVRMTNNFLNLKFKIRYLLFTFLTLFSCSIFATCAAGDQLCSAQTTFLDNFGPSSTVVYIILGGGAVATLITALATHNYKLFLTVVVGFIFVTAIFAII